MAEQTKRDLVKQAVRVHSVPEGPDWDQAAKMVGLDPEELRAYRRTPKNWPKLCREVAQELLDEAVPVAIRRLGEAAKADTSSSGVTAAKAIIDIHRALTGEARGVEDTEAMGDGIDFGELSAEEREIACRLLGVRRQGGAG